MPETTIEKNVIHITRKGDSITVTFDTTEIKVLVDLLAKQLSGMVISNLIRQVHKQA